MLLVGDRRTISNNGIRFSRTVRKIATDAAEEAVIEIESALVRAQVLLEPYVPFADHARRAHWPGTVPAGQTSNEVIAFQDMLPTFAELAGAHIPDQLALDGISVCRALAGGTLAASRRHLYWDYGHCRGKAYTQAVRLDDWKGIRRATTGVIELYDLSQDIGEANNIAATHPEIVERRTAPPAVASFVASKWLGRPRESPLSCMGGVAIGLATAGQRSSRKSRRLSSWSVLIWSTPAVANSRHN